MESQGCGFLNALRAAFATLKRKISKRGVRQRQKNYRIRQMQAMERMEQVRDKVRKPGLKKPASLRAQLVASGWRPNGEPVQRRSMVQVRRQATMRGAVLAAWEARQGQEHAGDTEEMTKEITEDFNTDLVLHEQVKPPLEIRVGDGDTRTSSLTCCALKGEKAYQQDCQTMVLEGIPVVQEKMVTRCIPMMGKKACSQRWQEWVLQETPVAQDKGGEGTDSISQTLPELQNDDGNEDQVKTEDPQSMSLLDEAELCLENSDFGWLGSASEDEWAEGRVCGFRPSSYIMGFDDGHVTSYIRRDDCTEAAEDYSFVWIYLIIICCIIAVLYFSY